MIMVKDKTLKISADSHRRLKLIATSEGVSIKSYLEKVIMNLYENFQEIDTLPLSEEEKEDLKTSEEDIKAGRVYDLEEVINEDKDF
jgi:hypothetical protein